ncbi:DUF6270 domain-containing protein [Glutamicibacter sp. TV12E]|uniref:DUF6270 domain-containing protein n=1 Tax=Glutamicibacter sp. TV12E TaxID=3446362 RepID=UPI0040347687
MTQISDDAALPINVAVIGSCVTRDVFNRRFCPNYKMFFKCGSSLIQGSLISFVSDPFTVPEADLVQLKDSIVTDIRSEMTREVNTYIATKKPEYVIFDFFGDIRFGAAQLKDATFVTRNQWKLTKTDFYKENLLREFLPQSEQYFDMWAEAVAEAVNYIRRVSPYTKLVLHDVEFVTKYREKNGQVKEMGNASALRAMNVWWRKLNTYFSENYADEVICVRNDDTMSFVGHPWGVYGVHYELDYHADFLNNLTRMALTHARSSQRAMV